MTQDANAPPPFQVNTIELVSVESSKITGVSVYSGRAEVTRAYRFAVKTGQNQVKISGLPNVLDHDSLRVEGRGAATIHGVTIAPTPIPPTASTSPALQALLLKQSRLRKASTRSQKAAASLEAYLNTLNAEKIGVEQLGTVVAQYEVEGEKIDDRLIELEQQVKDVQTEIDVETARLRGSSNRNHELGQTATVGVFAEQEGEVEIVLIYAVYNASWSATYDIRVNMQAEEKPITLIYKAAISQSTGESWEDVPLTLETVTPTYGTELPILDPWRISIYKRPAPRPMMAMAVPAMAMRSVRAESAYASMPAGGPGAPPPPPMPVMQQMQLSVASQGNMSATYQVPGLISIPSDGQAHNVTIVQLELDAVMSWVSVPRVDTRVHLKAKIKNASEFTLLSGNASVYVDGSFISKSDVPAVSPQESFDCPLGLDSAVRITYHPLSKKAGQSGFYSKSSTRSYTQRVTVHNTKSTAIGSLTVVDHVPISEDSQITVKLLAPVLPDPGNKAVATAGGGSGKEKEKVRVSEGVVAQWDGADDEEADPAALGKEGKLNWVCKVPPQGKLNLMMQWEVTSPLNVVVLGL
ncbi:hypothetical protein HGRIS_012526 [Hohenbuehelia grisea]|uniref:Mucoidy inhibitor A n=1 Tax=Hohenbuehelia grisea TaxID=104357 RepID=A0ABR3ISN0_9AGAR